MNRRSDGEGSANFSGSEATKAARSSFGKPNPISCSSRERHPDQLPDPEPHPRALLQATLREVAGRGLTDVRLRVHPDNVRLARRLSGGATSAVLAGAWSRSPGRFPTCSTWW